MKVLPLYVCIALAVVGYTLGLDARATVVPHVILGVRANQDGLATLANPDAAENDLLEVEGWAGRKLGDNQYSNWHDFSTSAPLVQNTRDIAKGRPTPLLSWKPFQYNGGCATMQDIAAGVYDAQISDQAIALANVGGPIMVRWFYEMEHTNVCAYGFDNVQDPVAGGALYVAAYRHIHDLVAPLAPNVKWVFAPGGDAFNDPNGNPITVWANYYPGDTYADWVAEDVYNGVVPRAFQTYPGFVNFYNQAVLLNKPLMVSETGALCTSGPTLVYCPGAKWIDTARDNLQNFPAVQAWFWWSSVGQRDFRLTGAEIPSFTSMGGDPYFQRMSP